MSCGVDVKRKFFDALMGWLRDSREREPPRREPLLTQDNWVRDFQKVMFRIALVRAKLDELRRAKVHCPHCGWLDYRIKDLERELKLLQGDLEKLRPRGEGE